VPEPIDFRIIQNLQTALRGISTVAGYHYDIVSVAVKLDPNQDTEALVAGLGERPFVVVEVFPDTFAYQAARRVRVTTPITIHWVHDSDPTNDDSWLQVFSRGCADVEQAIAQDIRRGALAQDTLVLSREFQTFGGSQVWAMVKTQVRVERIYGAPNG
jgi:hypothetical protein